jgi:hypothetical protein
LHLVELLLQRLARFNLGFGVSREGGQRRNRQGRRADDQEELRNLHILPFIANWKP